jgi:eukaryotic-like serine/threonine-protein kinase
MSELGILPQPIPYGKYYLLERVNIGGMAEIYKAKAFGVEGFERLLAVKKILASIAEDESFINMFIDEAKIAGQLNHPNIAQIFDLGKVDGSYFIAMEYISGKDLKTIFERARRLGEKVSIPRVCHLMMKSCEGLGHAHHKKDAQGRDLNIVHRDVSPQNVLLSYEGEVKIIDFGIAKAQGKTSQTQVGILKGKFSYMSPEQVRGLHIDHRSDIFSLGIVLYELLTLERLFLGDSDFDTLEKIRKVEMSPPTLYNPHIPKELEDIVLKALAKSPEDRYQTSYELADALEQFMRNQGYYFTNKDLGAYMKEAFSADIEFENKKLEYYRSLNLRAPEEAAKPVALPVALQSGVQGGGLSWGEDEMATNIFDRMDMPSGEHEIIAEADIVYSQQLGGGREEGEPPTVEYSRQAIQQSLEQLSFEDDAPDKPFRPSTRNNRMPTAQMSAIEPRRDRHSTIPNAAMAPGVQPQGGLPTTAIAIAVAIVAIGVVVIVLAFPFKAEVQFETTPADVRIVVDGTQVYEGATPFTYKISPGTHKVEISKEGFDTITIDQEFQKRTTYKLLKNLKAGDGTTPEVKPPVETKPTPGDAVAALVSLRVNSEPKGADFSVYEKGQTTKLAHGTTPELVEGLKPDKTYRVVVERKEFKTWEQEFTAGADKKPTLLAALVKDEATKPTEVAKVDPPKETKPKETKSKPPKETKPKDPPKEVAKVDPPKETKPKDPPKEEPKEVGTATLSIASKPAARVIIDDKDTGRYTPLIGFKVPATKHKVELVNDEFGLRKTYYVTLKPGEERRLINKPEE